MNKDKIEVLNTIAANNGHKDWLELTHCEGPITIMNCTIEAMELYAQTAQLQQHGVVRPAVESGSEGEPLPAEGSGEANMCAGGGKHLLGTKRKIFGMRKCRKCGKLI